MIRFLAAEAIKLAFIIAAFLVGWWITPGDAETMVASYYGYESGTHTASGERFQPLADTCAHKRLPFGTRLRVTYRGRSVVCRVNDRGPFIAGRDLDLSLGLARRIGLVSAGHGRVEIERLPQ